MTISKPNVVRLLSAVLAAAVSVWFVVNYTRFSHSRFEFEHPDGTLSSFNSGMLAYGHWICLLPILALAIGLWLLFARPLAATTFEIVLSVTWLLPFALVVLCILSWQVQNVPVFSHMEWHY